MLQLKNIKKDYVTASETVHALKGVSLSFRTREFVSILGPSGCGKTTMLNIIGGLDKYTSGDLIINGKSTRSYRDRHWDVYRNHRVGFIFQSYNLIPHQTVLGNVELALTIAGISKAERVSRAKAALDKVGLSGQYYKRPNQLSGGQCQRVAIARALVNDPEILLADEPTGALDTATSVQIMELIKEIAKERLVIMVTHNPELADKYSTRIIRFLDGRIVEDTNPVTAKEEAAEARAEREMRRKRRRLPRGKRCGREKAKMSWFTAFRLSAVNLMSKKGRSLMVSIAGSIGIVGIAMVLAFSAGIKAYIASMQDDMLSGNPIIITESTYDLDALMNMMDRTEKEEIIKESGKVFINSIVEYIATMNTNVNSMIIKNDITEAYVNYVKNMPKEMYAALLLDYGLDLSNNVYTDVADIKGGEARGMSVAALTNIYTEVLKQTDFAQYASYVSQVVPSFEQIPNNPDYIAEQYDITGKLATGRGEIVLVLDKNDRLSDVLLARLGYYAEDEFLNIVYGATGNELYDEALARDYFTNDELIGKTFTWYPNDTVFTKRVMTDPTTGAEKTSFIYNHLSEGFENDGAVELTVVGILSPKDEISYGSLSTGVYYTEALTDYIIEASRESEIVNYLNDAGTDNFGMNGMYYLFSYTFEGATKQGIGFIGQSLGLTDLASLGSGGTTYAASTGTGSGGGTGSGMGGMGGFDMSSLGDIKILSIRNLGGVDIANAISVYPNSFDSKDLVTSYLDEWNSDKDIVVDGVTLTKDDRSEVKYTDALELVINLINTMIDAVSTALIAFTSVSLIVSTVMIGIITYVSVVERIKEIGVIRSLGGRKRDVGNLFRSETFIIGLTSGLFGVGVTYIASFIVSAIVKANVGIANIAQLPVSQAAILVLASVLLTSISGLIPARSAAKKDPVVALRTE